MDKIYLDHLEFFAYHGCLEQEKKEGQTFYISLILELDLTMAAEDDDLTKTVNYGEVYDMVADITLHNKFDLIEKLAYTIINRILYTFSTVRAVAVRVDKPKAPGKTGPFPAAVELRRERI
jgi:dihydroneopterin aldolase